jgi:hypothetical protein
MRRPRAPHMRFNSEAVGMRAWSGLQERTRARDRSYPFQRPDKDSGVRPGRPLLSGSRTRFEGGPAMTAGSDPFCPAPGHAVKAGPPKTAGSGPTRAPLRGRPRHGRRSHRVARATSTLSAERQPRAFAHHVATGARIHFDPPKHTHRSVGNETCGGNLPRLCARVTTWKATRFVACHIVSGSASVIAC